MDLNVNKINFDLKSLLADICRGGSINSSEIKFLLELSDHGDIEALFKAARSIRENNFSNKIFMYGFIYFSTHCRNNCNFCHYRRSNSASSRYRMDPEKILESACNIAESGVHLIDLTMGEDPLYFKNINNFEMLPGLVESIKTNTGLPVMISPGVIPDDLLIELSKAGASWYACYQETHNHSLFNKLRPDQKYDDRMSLKKTAHEKGILIEEGILSNVGETYSDIAESINEMRAIDADQVRIMTFIPQDGTPMAAFAPADPLRELITIAVMRLTFPDRLIPASLDIDGLAGLRLRLDAGANVVTSLVPPGKGLAGVAHHSLDIEEARRTPESIIPVLEQCGLQTGTLEDYMSWVEIRHQKLNHYEGIEKIAC